MAIDTRNRTRQFATHINIPVEKREALVELLNHSLAETFDLFSQTKQAHWNVKGKDFYQLHLLFDEIAEELEEFVDMIAERATALGGYATGTVRMAAEASGLPEFPTETVEGMDLVRALAERFGQYVGRIRQNIDEATDLDDQATADLYNDVARAVDKRLYFLDAHLQRQD